MSKFLNNNIDLRDSIVEMVAVFGLVFFGLGAVALGSFYFLGGIDAGFNILNTFIIAFAHGFYIFVAIASFSRISGAHINPAVTISMWVHKKISSKKALFYLVAQFIGGILGGIVWSLIFNSPVGVHSLSSELFTTSVIAGLSLEIICTAFLTAVIFSTIDNESHFMTALAIGVTVCLGIIASLPFTGGSLNPARSLGPAVAFGEYKDIWIYFVGPIIGAIIGSFIGNLFNPNEN
ncbi:MAG: hypothetical protein CL907_04975 [Dehalococcoidia bacterium]|nr:hypothetical protein [Dehalococcoidia bacterium]|tara:strand:- start:644 stop:1348 length:705 start_codon:yes stop_codon:yes gene_type:complete